MELEEIKRNKDILKDEIENFVKDKVSAFNEKHKVNVSVSVGTTSYKSGDKIYSSRIDVEAFITI